MLLIKFTIIFFLVNSKAVQAQLTILILACEGGYEMFIFTHRSTSDSMCSKVYGKLELLQRIIFKKRLFCVCTTCKLE